MRLALLAALAAGPAAAQELQLYNWGDYTSPELIERFEAETGIEVTVTDYDSNDTALAKLQAGGHGFDLAVPSAPFVPVYVDLGLAQELDLRGQVADSGHEVDRGLRLRDGGLGVPGHGFRVVSVDSGLSADLSQVLSRVGRDAGHHGTSSSS